MLTSLVARHCSALNEHSAPCGMPPLRDGLYCFAHAPEHERARTVARRTGGRNRARPSAPCTPLPELLAPLDSADGWLQTPEIVRSDLLALPNSVQRNKALVQTVSMAVGIQRYQADAIELPQLRAMVEALS